MIDSKPPRVSVAVPVYNGHRYVRATLDSLLAQTYQDFELIVCDNASTDETERICREYAGKDPRVVYTRADRNLGPAWNFNRGVELARGEFFKWNAADDVCAPEFLQKCIDVLDAEPDVVVAYPRTRMIDSSGAVTREYSYELDYSPTQPSTRLRRLMCVRHKDHGAHELYGVMRTAALKAAGPFGRFVRADSVLLARLCLLGRFKRVEEFLFYNRDHEDRSARSVAKRHVRAGSWLSRHIGCGPLPPAEWWDPAMKGRIAFPEWRVLREYLRAVQQTKLSFGQKLQCYGVMLFFALRHIPKLGRDILIATEQGIRKFLGFSLLPAPAQPKPVAIPEAVEQPTLR